LKIYQAYHQDFHKKHLLPNTEHLDVRAFPTPRREYDIFEKLRPEGDFGVISWKFTDKTWLDEWEETAREKLKTHDCVMINPFPAVSAVSHNCWQSHPSLIDTAKDLVDVDQFQEKIAFCLYILAKKDWWTRFFEFVEPMLKHPGMQAPSGYARGADIPQVGFIVERVVNYMLDGVYIWEYPVDHHLRKYGTTEFLLLDKVKHDFDTWSQIAGRYNINHVAALDDRT